MSDNPLARLYLVAPAQPGLSRFPDVLARLLDSHDITCVRIAAGDAAEETIARTADTLRPVCHERDVPLLLTDHFRLVTRLGLDGVHLSDGSRKVRAARKELGLAASQTTMVGDTMETDILGGVQMGYRTVLVLSGGSRREDLDRYAFRPDVIVNSIADLVDCEMDSLAPPPRVEEDTPFDLAQWAAANP